MNPPDTPSQVRQAIALLWISQILVVVDAVLALMFPDEPDMAGETGFLVIVFLVLLGVYATLITFAAR